jgi:hypothetical protein
MKVVLGALVLVNFAVCNGRAFPGSCAVNGSIVEAMRTGALSSVIERAKAPQAPGARIFQKG